MKFFSTLALLVACIVAQVVAQDAPAKYRYHVSLPKPTFDSARASFGDELDIWDEKLDNGGKVQADIYMTDATMSKLNATAHGITILKTDASSFESQAVSLATCSSSTRRHLETINNSAAKYVDNAFFDCWRNADEVFAFLDTLVTANPTLMTKNASVSTSYENRAIPAYKISNGGCNKKVIYIQALIHAREWHAGSTTFYAMAALLDGLRSGDATITALVTKYDWVFVPIVNIDGFRFTFSSGNRLWRKNRRPVTTNGTTTYGVDLNRNFGPAAYFGKAGDGPVSETYPGTAVLSEPETAGIFTYLKTLPLAGAIDIHAYSGLVLRPFGNQYAEAAAPYDTKLKILGDSVTTAIQVGNSATYTSETASTLYPCYGTVLDSIFLEFNKTASLSFEMEGSDFVVDSSVIRPGGLHVFQGILQFAKELEAYYI
ncbi:Carboxypeptidase [Globisporangium polare]